MSHLMGDDIIDHETRRQDQPPGKVDRPIGRAAAPTASRVADADAPDGFADFLSLLQGPALELAASLVLQPILDAAGQMLRPAGDMDLACLAPDEAPLPLAVA